MRPVTVIPIQLLLWQPHVGNAGISIIRMSGSESFNIASEIFRGRVVSWNILLIRFAMEKLQILDTGEVIDEVLITKMAAPKTYTTEDVVEINCHGGFVTAKGFLNCCSEWVQGLQRRASLQKRAFMNGRIDLVQAEAIADLIGSITEKVQKLRSRSLKAGCRRYLIG